MWISPSAGSCRLLRITLLLLPVAAGISGCANPGPPKPPSLNLPSPVKDLRAERIGTEVKLTWTTPAETTDALPTKPPLSAEICREAGNSISPAACTVVQHVAVHSGAEIAVDPLPAPLLADPVQLLRYRVRILNASGHAAEASNVAFAAAGTAPAPISGLRSSSSPEGTRILWQPVNSPAAEVRLQRTAIVSVIQPAASDSAASAKSAPAFAQKKQVVLAPVQLLASASSSDRGGTLDTSGQRDVTYSYVAWRTRPVLINGRAAALRSQNSSPLVITIRDTTPPATPTGLEAIVDAGSVDLSWEPDTETDLAGYWVERADATEAQASSESQSWHRLNLTPLSAPAYRDRSLPGVHDLQYRILAVDNTGNLSRPTPPVAVRLRADPAP